MEEQEEYIEALKGFAEVAKRIIERNKETIAEINEVMTDTTNLFKRGASHDSIGKSRPRLTENNI